MIEYPLNPVIFGNIHYNLATRIKNDSRYWSFVRISSGKKVSDYLDRVLLYFDANGVAEGKQVAVLLTAIVGETYALLTSLLSPAKPRDKSFAEITAVLKKQNLNQS